VPQEYTQNDDSGTNDETIATAHTCIAHARITVHIPTQMLSIIVMQGDEQFNSIAALFALKIKWSCRLREQ
jgi:hypothetical protein